MQNLREQLLKAGLITEEQRKRADESAKDKNRKGRPPQDNRGKKPEREARPSAPAAAPETSLADESPDKAVSAAQKPKLTKKQLMKQPVNRMVDLSDPNTLRVFRAIEEHRVREETKGDVAFHFTLRDGHVRKIFVKKAISEGLEEGRLAIVESGEQNRHVIVSSAALAEIRAVDPEVVRFANG